VVKVPLTHVRHPGRDEHAPARPLWRGEGVTSASLAGTLTL